MGHKRVESLNLLHLLSQQLSHVAGIDIFLLHHINITFVLAVVIEFVETLVALEDLIDVDPSGA
jgi:hypothetical protein